MDVHKVWAWLKIIMTVVSVGVLIAFLVGGYFWFKGNLVGEETEELDGLRAEYKEKIKQVIIAKLFFCFNCVKMQRVISIVNFLFLQMDAARDQMVKSQGRLDQFLGAEMSTVMPTIETGLRSKMRVGMRK